MFVRVRGTMTIFGIDRRSQLIDIVFWTDKLVPSGAQNVRIRPDLFGRTSVLEAIQSDRRFRDMVGRFYDSELADRGKLKSSFTVRKVKETQIMSALGMQDFFSNERRDDDHGTS